MIILVNHEFQNNVKIVAPSHCLGWDVAVGCLRLRRFWDEDDATSRRSTSESLEKRGGERGIMPIIVEAKPNTRCTLIVISDESGCCGNRSGNGERLQTAFASTLEVALGGVPPGSQAAASSSSSSSSSKSVGRSLASCGFCRPRKRNRPDDRNGRLTSQSQERLSASSLRCQPVGTASVSAETAAAAAAVRFRWRSFHHTVILFDFGFPSVVASFRVWEEGFAGLSICLAVCRLLVRFPSGWNSVFRVGCSGLIMCSVQLSSGNQPENWKGEISLYHKNASQRYCH